MAKRSGTIYFSSISIHSRLTGALVRLGCLVITHEIVDTNSCVRTINQVESSAIEEVTVSLYVYMYVLYTV